MSKGGKEVGKGILHQLSIFGKLESEPGGEEVGSAGL